jgi:hypothetical protein
MTLGDMELVSFKTGGVGRDAMASAITQIFLRVFGMLVCKFFVQIFTVLSCIEASCLIARSLGSQLRKEIPS